MKILQNLRRLTTRLGTINAALNALYLRKNQKRPEFSPDPKSFRQIGTESGLAEVCMLTNTILQNHLVLKIIWNTPLPEHRGSRVVLAINQVLKTFGLVEHSVWVKDNMDKDDALVLYG